MIEVEHHAADEQKSSANIRGAGPPDLFPIHMNVVDRTKLCPDAERFIGGYRGFSEICIPLHQCGRKSEISGFVLRDNDVKEEVIDIEQDSACDNVPANDRDIVRSAVRDIYLFLDLLMIANADVRLVRPHEGNG